MPCYDPRDNSQYHVEANQRRLLEAMLCAIFNELEKRDILFSVVERASKNGGIEIKEFWKKHKAEDEIRLSYDLNRYSQHEKKVMLNLLHKQLDSINND